MNDPVPAISAQASARPSRHVQLIFLIVAAVILVAFRLHAFDLPLETDECNYAYIAARLLEGDRLYVDVWDHQPPGVFILFAGVIALFGDAPVLFRVMACGFSIVSMLLIFGIVRRLVGSWPAIGAAFLFAIVSSDPGTAGEGCQREIYMNTLILAAWYLASKGGEPARRRKAVAQVRAPVGTFFAAGLCLGLASLIKTVIAVHWVALTLWIVLVYFIQTVHVADPTGKMPVAPGPPKSLRRAVRALLSFSLGPLLVWGGTFIYFALTDRWTDFTDAVFTFNLGYSGDKSLLARFLGFFTPDRHPFIFDSAIPLWIAAAIASLVLIVQFVRRKNVRTNSVLWLLIASFVAVCLPGRSWPHYYYLMIPPLVICTMYALGWLALRSQIPAQISNTGFLLAVSMFAAVFLSTLYTQYRDYLSQPPFGITIKRYNSRDFWGRGQGENVRRVTKPNDAIFVFGNDASIYYYANRRCASRYTMITGLSDGMNGAERRRRILMEELRARPPRLILLLSDQPPFDEWKSFLNEFYGEPVGWDLHDQTRNPIMFVLARKDAPIETIEWDWDRSAVGGWMLGEKAP